MKYTVKILLFCSIILIAQCNSVPPVSDSIKSDLEKNFAGCNFKCISGDCNNGEGTVEIEGKCFFARYKYIGSFKNGKPNGMGASYFLGDKMYEGEFKNGLPHGNVKLILDEGIGFEGSFRYGIKHGYGVEYIYNNKKLVKSYTGLWLNGNQEGLHYSKTNWGDKVYINERNYKNGQWNGPAKEYYIKDSSLYKYVGNYENCIRHGKGKIYLVSFKPGKEIPNIECEYKNGKKHGEWIYYVINWDSAIGKNIVNFRRFYNEDQIVKTQEYLLLKKKDGNGNYLRDANDERIIVGSYIWTESLFKNGKMHGLSKRYNNNGNGSIEYLTPYVNGKIHGKAITYSNNGDFIAITDEYVNGKKHGKSISYDKNGHISDWGITYYENGIAVKEVSDFFKGIYKNDRRYKGTWYEYDDVSKKRYKKFTGYKTKDGKKGTEFYERSGTKKFVGTWKGDWIYNTGTMYTAKGQRINRRLPRWPFFQACVREGKRRNWFKRNLKEGWTGEKYVSLLCVMYYGNVNLMYNGLVSKEHFKKTVAGETFIKICPGASRSLY